MAIAVKEIGSGVNEARPKPLKLLNDPEVTLIVMEHKERLTRFGDNTIGPLLKLHNRRVAVIHLAQNGKEDRGRDFVSMLTSFCARLDGQRRSKRTTGRIIAERTGTSTARGAEQ